MKSPNDNIIIKRSIELILESINMLDKGFPDRCERKLAYAVVILNQITEIEDFQSSEVQEQFEYCIQLILGK